jgi:hypothetical protein
MRPTESPAVTFCGRRGSHPPGTFVPAAPRRQPTAYERRGHDSTGGRRRIHHNNRSGTRTYHTTP